MGRSAAVCMFVHVYMRVKFSGLAHLHHHVMLVSHAQVVFENDQGSAIHWGHQPSVHHLATLTSTYTASIILPCQLLQLPRLC
jgi:hypothetical protein